jgi:outer membrane lipoprotein carrier protein
MKKYSILFALIVYTIAAFSQSSTKKIPDDESVTILETIQQKLKKINTAEIKFSLRSEKDNKTLQIIKGDLWIKGSKYKLILPTQHVYCDSINVWNYLPEQKEVTISHYDANDQENAINPIKLITNYKKYYRSAFIRETTEKGLVVQIIDLYPLKGTSFFKIRLFIDKNNSEILRVSISEKDGSTYTYSFDNFIKNPKLNNDLFIFNTSQYKDIEIIDMR